jgi:hypothetical protein
MGEGDFDFDWGSLFSGNESPSGIDLSGLEDMNLTGVGDLPSLDFDKMDLSSLIDLANSQTPGDFGESLSSELAAALQDSGNSSSLFSGDGGIDVAALLGSDNYKFNPDDYRDAFASGDVSGSQSDNYNFDVKDYADAYASGDNLMGSGRYETNLNKDQLEEGFDLEKAKAAEKAKADAYDENAPKPEYGVQDSGVSQEMMDEFNKNFQPKNGFASQWQTVGTNKVMVNDDGTSTILNPTTGQTSYLTAAQTKALTDNNTLNTKGSGYVDATGGTGVVPGGGKTIVNGDGTKTVVTTDGKVLTVDKDGKVTDTGKVVDVNNPKLETDPKKVIDTAKTTTTPGTPAKPAANNNNMLMMLLALMAMMNKGGGSSTGSGGTIPSLAANRSQLPYAPVAGAQAARPGAGGVTYFSPTTYTPKAAGGGLMSLAGGGMSDLGSYSDGGRLLRGPGDGVSDSIPATIGGKQPARLATGEFVVPARIVSELGNGSTDAGAQKLYAMMDRVQKARRKTKNVAADTKAHKYLPA